MVQRVVGGVSVADCIGLRHGSQTAATHASWTRRAGIFPFSSHGNVNIHNPALWLYPTLLSLLFLHNSQTLNILATWLELNAPHAWLGKLVKHRTVVVFSRDINKTDTFEQIDFYTFEYCAKVPQWSLDGKTKCPKMGSLIGLNKDAKARSPLHDDSWVLKMLISNIMFLF